MKKIAILTSGGDAPGMNAAIRAVVKTALGKNIEVIGIKEGYKGLLEEEFINMKMSSVADIIHRGGTILRSSRSLEFQTPEGIDRAAEILKKHNIEGVVILGGDGTFRGAKELSNRGVSVAAIPCTIDNDMGYTDYTIGFFTSVETIIDAISKIRDTSSSHGRGNVVEVMGRHCGDLAIYAGLAGGAESIIIPELPFNIDDIIKKTMIGRDRGKVHNIVILTEDIANPYEVAKKIQEATDVIFRVSVLGHIQRGGSPTAFDRILASKIGYYAIEELLKEDKKEFAVGIKGDKIIVTNIIDAVETKTVFHKDNYDIANILSM